ncbi:hypothetical protein OAP56_02720 [Rickettsiaceae bacterium]|nr:hypothetical protein [Rickettsiaceae bacterium]
MSLLRAAGMVKIISHDWWAYILISGASGKMIYDEIPSLYYRQHGKNIIGSNNGVIAKCKRIAMLFKGNYKQWNQSNVNALSTVKGSPAINVDSLDHRNPSSIKESCISLGI